MHLIPVADMVVLPPGVARWMLSQRHGDSFDDDVIERNPYLLLRRAGLSFSGCEQRLARLPYPIHLDFAGEIEGGDRSERLAEPAGDGLPDLGKRNVGVRLGSRAAGYWDRLPHYGGSGRGRVLDLREITRHNATLGATPTDFSEVQAALSRNAPRQGRRFDPIAGGGCRRRSTRRSWSRR